MAFLSESLVLRKKTTNYNSYISNAFFGSVRESFYPKKIHQSHLDEEKAGFFPHAGHFKIVNAWRSFCHLSSTEACLSGCLKMANLGNSSCAVYIWNNSFLTCRRRFSQNE